MIKRLFIVAPALSLLLCGGSVILWISSYHTGYELSYCKRSAVWGWAPATHRSLFVARGFIAFATDTYPEERGMRDPPIRRGYTFQSFPVSDMGGNTDWLGADTPSFHLSALGFQVEAGDWKPVAAFGEAPPVGHGFLLAFPLWPATVLLALWPLLWFRRRRRWNGRDRGRLCLSCGYDLRASKDRCPECGAPISALDEVNT